MKVVLGKEMLLKSIVRLGCPNFIPQVGEFVMAMMRTLPGEFMGRVHIADQSYYKAQATKGIDALKYY
jgi:hypothetical protein